MAGLQDARVVVDLDCTALHMTNDTRCDYLFVSETNVHVIVAPIEFKQGSLSATHVLHQLDQGAARANEWLPTLQKFEFVPVLAHQGLRRPERDRLRKAKLTFRNRRAQVKLARCGSRIAAILPPHE